MREHSHDPDVSWAREASAPPGTKTAPAWIWRARRRDGDPLGVNHKALLVLAWSAVSTSEPGHRTVDATAARLLQEDVAELCEVSVATIRRWERELRTAGLMARPRPGLLVLADVLAAGYLSADPEAGEQVCVACMTVIPPEPAPTPQLEQQVRPAPPPVTRRVPSELWRIVTEHPITTAHAVEGSIWASAMAQWVASSAATPALLRHVLDALAAETASHRDRGTLTEAWNTQALPRAGALFYTTQRYKGSAKWLSAAYDRATKALAPRSEYSERPVPTARELARMELEREPASLGRETSTPTRSATEHPRSRRPR